MQRNYYSNKISSFLNSSDNEIIGILAQSNEFTLEASQKEAWNYEIETLKKSLRNLEGNIYFEYSIPRMGRRIDVVLIIKNVIFILEFKVGEKHFLQHAIDQVWDYALDLKNFHEPSHEPLIAPILIATESESIPIRISTTEHNDNILVPLKSNENSLKLAISEVLKFAGGKLIDADVWANGRYSPHLPSLRLQWLSIIDIQ